MAKPGPPRKVTCDEALEAVRDAHGIVKDAADELGCSQMTIYRRAEEDDRIWDAIEEGREQIVREARDRVQNLMREADSDRVRYDAALKLLAVFDEEVDWADRKRTDITSGGEPITEINLNVVHTDADDFEQEVRE